MAAKPLLALSLGDPCPWDHKTTEVTGGMTSVSQGFQTGLEKALVSGWLRVLGPVSSSLSLTSVMPPSPVCIP